MVAGANFEEFAKDELKVLAALQILEVIGEASKRVPDSLKSKYPEISWKDVAGTRDKLKPELFREMSSDSLRRREGFAPVLRYE